MFGEGGKGRVCFVRVCSGQRSRVNYPMPDTTGRITRARGEIKGTIVEACSCSARRELNYRGAVVGNFRIFF